MKSAKRESLFTRARDLDVPVPSASHNKQKVPAESIA